MFTIYRKNVDGRIFDRYFRKWENARLLLIREVNQMFAHGWTKEYHEDYFNSSKGFCVFYYELLSPEGEKATLSLIDGEFAD